MGSPARKAIAAKTSRNITSTGTPRPATASCAISTNTRNARFPIKRLLEENARRSRSMRRSTCIDTGAFEQNRYFDVEVFYAKASPDEIHIRIIATNRGPEAAELHLLPTLWFRNTWSWMSDSARPSIRAIDPPDGSLGRWRRRIRNWAITGFTGAMQESASSRRMRRTPNGFGASQ